MPVTPSPVRTAARELADPRHLRAALRPHPADATVAAALRCGATVALALGLCAALGRTDLAGFAALGALTSLYGRFEPYRRRAALVALVGALLTAAYLVTAALTTAGVPASLVHVVVAVIAGVTTVLCVLLRTGPPGATIVVFAAAGGLAGQVAWSDVAQRGTAFAGGALIAWLVVMSGYLVRPSGPARLAVRRADAAARRAAGGDADAAWSVVERARLVLADDLSHRRTRDTARVLAAELAAIGATLGADPAGQPSTRPSTRPSTDDGTRTPAPADTLPARRRLRDDVRLAWDAPDWRPAGLRVTVSSLAAGAVALVAGLGHPAWAQMGATATLQGSTTHHAVVRALQRGAGTALGALLAWPLLAAHLSFAATAAVVVALQIVTEVVVGRHYGLAMLTITPMALLMTSLGSPGDPSGMAVARALDTVLGAALGVLAVVLVHPRRSALRSPATPASR